MEEAVWGAAVNNIYRHLQSDLLSQTTKVILQCSYLYETQDGVVQCLHIGILDLVLIRGFF